MPEMCVNFGATVAPPAELIRHMSEALSGRSSNASLSMNPEAESPGLICALGGRRFDDRPSLAGHNLSPHCRASRSEGKAPIYQPAF